MTHFTGHDSFDAPFLALLDYLLFELLHLSSTLLLDRLLLRTLCLLLVSPSAAKESAQFESGCEQSDNRCKVDVVAQLLENELGSSVESAVTSELALREPPAALKSQRCRPEKVDLQQPREFRRR